MLLLMLHPLVAFRDCEHCLKYQYDETTGKPGRSKSGKGYIPRFTKPRCQLQRGCPKGSPENPRGFNQQNRQAYEHYKTCLAMNQFPDDPVVRRNVQIIQKAEDDARRLLDQ